MTRVGVRLVTVQAILQDIVHLHRTFGQERQQDTLSDVAVVVVRGAGAVAVVRGAGAVAVVLGVEVDQATPALVDGNT